MVPPADPDALSPAELKALVSALLRKVAELEWTVAAQREEIARLKGLKGRPAIKPSGMEQATEPKPPRNHRGRRGRGKVVPRVAVEARVLRATVPPGSRFQGYQDFLVQDLVLRTEAVRYRRERWLTPEGRLVVAPLPGGVDGHFGPELRRYVLAQYHQGQTTVPRLVAQLRAVGIAISKRQVIDRKSTRLNSSHANISYAVFCLKKKKKLIVDNIITSLRVNTDTGLQTLLTDRGYNPSVTTFMSVHIVL